MVIGRVLRGGADRLAVARNVEIDLLRPQRDPDIGAMRPGDAVVEIDLAQPRAVNRRAVRLVQRELAFEQVHRSDEIGHKPIGRIFVKVGRSCHLRHLAFVHHRDPPGHRQSFVLIVGDGDKGDPDVVLQFAQLKLHLRTQLGVERRQRLVEQQHLGLHHQTAREGHALALTA